MTGVGDGLVVLTFTGMALTTDGPEIDGGSGFKFELSIFSLSTICL